MRNSIVLGVVGVLAALVLAGTAIADDDRGDRTAVDSRADYTPFERFTPLAASAPCPGGEPGGRGANPLLVPAGYDQAIIAEETDPLVGFTTPGSEDLWDMHTQNESGKDAGRYVYRTHEVGAAPNSGDPPRSPGGSQVTVTDLKTGLTFNLAERNDWERFDGIAWTPWGTILAAEEIIRESATGNDPQVPHALAGLVYELFVDKDEPWKLDPSRERITAPQDGTQDFVQDGIRARPNVGSRSHEGLRFDDRGNLYGIAETRGQTVLNQTGGIFRFVPSTSDDDDDDDRGRGGDNRLAFGQLYVFRADGGTSYGPGRWILLDQAASQIDSDAEAETKGASQYQRPEDLETGDSTGVDRLNRGDTLYAAITEGAEVGVLNIDLGDRNRPVAYPYVGPLAGNAVVPDFNSADNLALDRKGNLAITEDAGGSSPGGDDIWIAAPPPGRGHQPASTVQRFATMKDCEAEPTGVYFALKGTERFSRHNPNAEVRELVNGDTLFVNRQHSEEGTLADQGVAVAPLSSGGNDDD
jgi:uncharacterized protein